MLILSSTREVDFVLDLFLVSGTTALVCQNLNRNFAGIEIRSKYVEMAENRLKDKFTKNNGVKLDIAQQISKNRFQ